MISKTELIYTLALMRAPNLGATSAKKLIQFIGSSEAVFKERKSNLLKVKGIGEYKLQGIAEKGLMEAAEAEFEFMERNSVSFSYYKDKDYPNRLKHCSDGPLLIFHQGNIDLQSKKIISIVGTRNITSYGSMFCKKIIEELSPLDPIIVSGYAYGVDITAHKAAMENGLQTIACLAHGFDQVYPKAHAKYLPKVKEHGGFITEFWSTDVFDRNNFLQRNRIIAGISEATIVIESAEKGGSLVTADIANSYHRDVFALPGRATDFQSKGCNNLIKTQQAHLLASAADLIYILGWNIKEKTTDVSQAKLFVELNKEEQMLYDYLKGKDKDILDKIALSCHFPTSKTASILLNMELKGVIRPLPGKFFQLIT